MKSDSAIEALRRFGFGGSSLQKSSIPKFCPLCVQQDIKKHGEMYWHRIHQIPNIMVCVEHNCILQDDPRILRPSGRNLALLSDVDMLLVTKEKNTNDKLLEISAILGSILYGQIDINFQTLDYYTLIKEAGYTKGKRLDTVELKKDLNEYYSLDVINVYFENSQHSYNGDTFRKLIYEKNHTFHPIRHILLWNFLNKYERNLNLLKKHPDIVRGPWKCLNKASDHYGESIIKTYHSRRVSKNNYVYTVKCKCGMVYTQVFETDDKSNINIGKIYVKEFGHVWLDKLKKLAELNLKPNEIAKTLGVIVPTLFKIASVNKVPLNYNPTEYSIIRNKEVTLSRYKKKWLELINKHTTKTIKELKSENRTIYDYIQKNDGKWLKETNNKIRDRYQRPGFKPRRDYENLDKILRDDLEIKLEELKKENPKCRLSVNYICRSTSHEAYIALEGLFNYYPLSKKFLEENCESLVDYQIRRLWNCANKLNEKNLLITKEKLIIRANLYHHPLSKKHFDAIEDILNYYNKMPQ